MWPFTRRPGPSAEIAPKVVASRVEVETRAAELRAAADSLSSTVKAHKSGHPSATVHPWGARARHAGH